MNIFKIFTVVECLDYNLNNYLWKYNCMSVPTMERFCNLIKERKTASNFVVKLFMTYNNILILSIC